MSIADEAERWVEPSARNIAEVFVGTAARAGFRVRRWDDLWVADLGSPEPLANSVLPLRPITDATVAEVAGRLDAFYGEAYGGGWSIWSAWPTPDLSSLGYISLGESPLMVRPAGGKATQVPDGLRIVEARDAETLADFERTLIDGYPLPTLQPTARGSLFRPESLGGPARYFVGYEGERPVAVGAACTEAGVTGIYLVATLPEARGRGYGAAITDAVARVDPASPAVLQASDMGYPVYERLGFQTVSRYSLWIRERRQNARS
jgi:GNAT superfamily N-acetyltransferase